MAGIEGIEPPSTVLETAILPFNYIPKNINTSTESRNNMVRNCALLYTKNCTCFFKLVAVTAGLEPAISCVTGRRPNQLDHATNGRYRDRTCDPLLVRQVLSQLS